MVDFIFQRRYSMAHRLLRSGTTKCAVPHGHNEVVEVRLSLLADATIPSATNMPVDFSDVKKRWHSWIDNDVDHSLHLADDDPLISYFRNHEPGMLRRVMTFPGDPTTEALCAAFFRKLAAFAALDGLPFAVTSVRVEETPTNAVILSADGVERFRALDGAGWWTRPDRSINDFDS